MQNREISTLFHFALQHGIFEHLRITGIITKTFLYNFDHVKPYFYIVKLGFTEVYNILRIFV